MNKEPKYTSDSYHSSHPTLTSYRYLFISIIYRAIYDYLNPELSSLTQYDRITAKAFLFDDEYYIDWGDMLIQPSDLFETVGLNIDYVRMKLQNPNPIKGRHQKFYD